MQRLFVSDSLEAGGTVEPSTAQLHYLLHVLRMSEGGELLLFNGRDGEWRGRFAPRGKKGGVVGLIEQTRPQPVASGLHYCFAPLKVGRLDYMVQKAVEMGAGVLQPVMTQHTQGAAPRRDKILANAVEAAEQCGVLALPEIRDAVRLDALLDGWDPARRLVFCDEGVGTDNPLPALQAMTERRFALLVGPEGGFSAEERRRLHALPFVTAIPLGPRILRADTAAVGALALMQVAVGDWR